MGLSDFMRFWLGVKWKEFNELRANNIFDWRGFFFCYQLAICIRGEVISERVESLVNKVYGLVVVDNYDFSGIDISKPGWLGKGKLLKSERDSRVLNLFSPILIGFERLVQWVLGESASVGVSESKEVVGGFGNIGVVEGPII